MENQTVNILMVDDRVENLMAIEAVLTSPEYCLVRAASGEEALRHVLKMDFAVILLDVQMPGIDGFETAQLIRAREKSKDIPIIFITALSQTQEHVSNGYQVGAIDYLFKPFPPLILKSKVAEFVKIYKAQRQIQEQNHLILENSKELEAAYTRLQKSEALSRAITETSIDSLFTLAGNGKIQSVNPAGSQMFGYSEEDFLQMKISKLVPLFSSCSLEDVKQGIIVESIAVRQDGSEFPVDIQLTNITIENEPFFVISIRDITERKNQYLQLEKLVQQRTAELLVSNQNLQREIEEKNKMMRTVSESRQMYKSLFQYHPDAVYSFDLEGRFISLNRGLSQLTGLSPEELLNHHFIGLVAERDREKTLANFQSAVNGEPQNYELEICHKEGHIVQTNVTNIPIIVDDQVIGVYGIAKDISLQKKLWQELAESEDKYRQLVEESPEAIIVQRLDSQKCSFINKTGLNLLGVQNGEDIIGKSLEPFVHPSQYIELLDKIEAIKAGLKVSTFDSKFITQHKDIIDVQVKCIPFVYRGVPSLHIVVRDITELKQSREFIKQSEKLTVVGELAAGIAHEIRNPLTSLRGFTQLLEYQMDTKVEYVPIMISEIDRINTIVSELLLLAKPNHVDFQRIELLQIIENIITLMKAQANLHGVEIVLRSQDIHSYYIYGLENKLKQVFINLLKNAIEAMPNGGNIVIQLERLGGQIKISVMDQGGGIPREFLDKIGQPFFTTKHTGTGLGIMVCQSIIDSHQGTMFIHSEEGKGTTVEIVLGGC
jgi:two-component system, sporulation sensor kinase E